jgi:glyoxylase-like metal-dependent hydrolase (beta-lactamase superfamily II)
VSHYSPRMDVRVISIGALAAHPLRGERAAARTGHNTTTLIRAGSKNILVDPGLPEAAIAARLDERAGLKPRDITHVLTSFNPDARRGITAFEKATWWIHTDEREQIGVAMIARLHEAAEEQDEAIKRGLEIDVAVMQRCEAAPDHLADEKGSRVDIFPMPGISPGMCGLIVSQPRATTLICGDAVATVEHLEAGKVLPVAWDVDKARESFAEAIEIADLLIPGRDNLVINPTKRLF